MATLAADTGKSRRSRRQFSEEFRAQAVRLVLPLADAVGGAWLVAGVAFTARPYSRGQLDRYQGGMGLPQLRIVVFPETTKAWTARSLEHDLAAVGRTADAALDALVRIASAHIAYDVRHGRPPLSAFAAAPRSYWHAFAGAASKSRPRELIRTEPQGALSCLVSVTSVNPAMRRLAPPRIA